MRIAMISPLFESVPPRLYGGTERVIYNLCRGLHDEDIEVTLFASADSSVEARVVPAIDQALRLRPIPVADPYAYSFRMLSLVAKHADEFDVIHNHHDYWMLPLSEMTAVPFLTTMHGRLDIPDIPAAFMSYPNAKYVSISDAQRGPLGLLDWVRTIHHGIPVEDFKFHPKPGKYLAFLGRISQEKKPHWAVEIAKKAGIPLKIAAKIEAPEGQTYWDQMIKPHVDGKFIEYLGEISEAEKSDFLGNALALVFPVDWPEPFGLVTIESLACGTPVLARPCGAIPEITKEGVTGFCSLDLAVLAHKATEVHRLDRAKCRAWVKEHFSLERMTKDYIDVYRQLTEQPETGRTYPGRGRRAVGDRRHLLHSL